jgi:hypothetical protein
MRPWLGIPIGQAGKTIALPFREAAAATGHRTHVMDASCPSQLARHIIAGIGRVRISVPFDVPILSGHVSLQDWAGVQHQQNRLQEPKTWKPLHDASFS